MSNVFVKKNKEFKTALITSFMLLLFYLGIDKDILRRALWETVMFLEIFSTHFSAYISTSVVELQSFTGYLRLGLVLVRNSALRERFNFSFSRVLC